MGGEIVTILRYLLHRVPMTTQEEHDMIALLIDGLEAIDPAPEPEKES